MSLEMPFQVSLPFADLTDSAAFCAVGDMEALASLRRLARPRIALFRALHLGDLLLAVPALRSLRAGFPRAEITLIGLKWAAAFVQHLRRYLDRFVEFVGYPGIGEVALIPARTEAFLAEQHAYHYDLVLSMHGSGRTSLPFCLALGARLTAGYYDGAPPDGLTLGAPYPTDRHEVLRHLGLARLLGCPPLGTELEFPVSDADRAEAAALIPDLAHADGTDVRWIAVHPGSRAPSHRWPVERFAQVADHLACRHDARIILLGGRGEEPLAAAVAAHMRTPAHNLAGRTSLGGLAALIEAASLYIGNDTGPSHLAVAVGTPSVTIFGPVDPCRWAPLDRQRHPIAQLPAPCSPCPRWICPIDHRCLRDISPHSVTALGESLLARFPRHQTCQECDTCEACEVEPAEQPDTGMGNSHAQEGGGYHHSLVPSPGL